MDAEAEKSYSGARTMLERLKAQHGAQALTQEVIEIQDLLECIEKNADRIAYMMKTSARKKTGDNWNTIRALLCEQDRLFCEITTVFVKLSKTKVVLRDQNGAAS